MSSPPFEYQQTHQVLLLSDTLCREKGVSQASPPGPISSIPITLRMGPHAQNHTLLYNILAPCWLCVHLVYKAVGTSRSTRRACGMRDHPTPE